MAGPPTPAFSQLTVIYGGAALPFPAATTHGFTTPTADIADVEEAFLEFVGDVRAALCNDVVVREVRWKVGPVATGTTVVYTYNLPGTISGTSNGPHTTTLVKLPVLGLSNRFAGRFYPPGVPETQVNPVGTLVNAYRTQVETSWRVAYDQLAQVGMEPRVFSSVSSDPRTVVRLEVDGRIATQRRRLRR